MSITAELDACTNDHYNSFEPKDIYHRANVLAMMLFDDAKMVSGGVQLIEPLQYATLNGGAFSATDTFDLTKVSIFTSAQFDWRHYYVNVTYDIDDDTQNDGPEKLVDVVQGKLKAADKEIRDLMGTGLYGAGSGTNGSNGITGLGNLFNTTTATTYGGLSWSDTTTWKPIVTTTSATLALSVMRSIRASATVGNTPDGRPNLYMTGISLYDAYVALLQASQRFTDSKLADLGFHNVLFEGVPVAWDHKLEDSLDSSGMYGLNTKFLRFHAKTGRFFNRSKWTRLHNSYHHTMQIFCSGNLCCSYRSAQIKRTGLV